MDEKGAEAVKHQTTSGHLLALREVAEKLGIPMEAARALVAASQRARLRDTCESNQSEQGNAEGPCAGRGWHGFPPSY